MNLTSYLGVTSTELQKYVNDGLVDTAFHPTFPLVLFTYSRKCVADQAWDKVTTKCRGLIANLNTDEIIARPFEKFFNFGESLQKDESGELEPERPDREPDYIVEKMDGFLCTMYTWEGKNYIASKGSFDSPHSRWATAWLNEHHPNLKVAPGLTAVFEGITPNLRIVVDYGGREELVLLTVIDNKTGVELVPEWLAQNFGFHTPLRHSLRLQDAVNQTLNPSVKNIEGYVLVWNRLGQTPFRLKLKYQDYLRIHRMVTGTSPKRVFEALVNGWDAEMDTWLDESVPWFSKFISRWKTALDTRYKELETDAKSAFDEIRQSALDDAAEGNLWTRKQWAERFKTRPEELHSVLFAMLDGKDYQPFIWKRVKPMIRGSHPLVDARL